MSCTQLIVWLDANANDSVSSFRSKLTEDSRQCVKIFIEIDSCIEFLQKNFDETIFFVLSGSLGLKVVPLIFDLKHIHQIYLFCGSIASHANWAMDYTDKMLMFDHEDDLLRRLFKDIELFLREQAEQYMKQANICKDHAQLFKQEPCG
jgi:hypothetical protein